LAIDRRSAISLSLGDILNAPPANSSTRFFEEAAIADNLPFGFYDVVQCCYLVTVASIASSESDLPWKVDLVDWATTSERFRQVIQQQKIVVN
jgi:hypothetical protein